MGRKNRGDTSAGNGQLIYERCHFCAGPPQTCKRLRCADRMLHALCAKHWKLAPAQRTPPADFAPLNPYK